MVSRPHKITIGDSSPLNRWMVSIRTVDLHRKPLLKPSCRLRQGKPSQGNVVLGLVQGIGHKHRDVTGRDTLSRNKVDDAGIDLGSLWVSTWRLVKLHVITLDVRRTHWNAFVVLVGGFVNRRRVAARAALCRHEPREVAAGHRGASRNVRGVQKRLSFDLNKSKVDGQMRPRISLRPLSKPKMTVLGTISGNPVSTDAVRKQPTATSETYQPTPLPARTSPGSPADQSHRTATSAQLCAARSG